MVNPEVNAGWDDYPRVSIDSLHDWQRIKDNYLNAAVATLDKKLAEQGLVNQRDLYVQHIMQFVDKTFETTEPNLRVNGRNYEEYSEDEEEVEQFDEALDRRVWSLSDQRRKWDLEIAKKRRITPREVEGLIHDLVTRQREYDDSAGALLEHPNMDVDDNNVDEAFEDTVKVHKDMLSLLEVLQRNVPAVLERSQRVKQVDKEIRTLKL